MFYMVYVTFKSCEEVRTDFMTFDGAKQFYDNMLKATELKTIELLEVRTSMQQVITGGMYSTTT